MKRRLRRCAASALAALAIGCEGQSTTPTMSSGHATPGPAAAAPAPVAKRGTRGDVPALGPSTAPLKE